MKTLITKFALLLCVCLLTLGCEDESLTSDTNLETLQAEKVKDKDKTVKDGKFLKNLKVDGVLADGGTFEGKLTITQFGYDETDGLWVSGNIHGTATQLDGTEVELNEDFSEVSTTLNETSGNARTVATQATCDILFLDLGPLSLDLLGLTIDLSEVILDINAVSGSGNLLGNLLCAVAGLLDGFGLLNDLIDGLSNLLDILGQINDLIG